MNKLIVLSFVTLFCLFQPSVFSSVLEKDSIYINTPERIEKDVFNDYYFGGGYYFGVVPNPFSNSNVYQFNFYLPGKTTVNFNMLDTNNTLVYKISSIEIEKGFYKSYLNIVKLKTGKYYLEMETARFRCRLIFYQIS